MRPRSRGTDNEVERLLGELDGIGQDRHLHFPILGPKPIVRGGHMDLQTRLTKAEFDHRPEVILPPA